MTFKYIFSLDKWLKLLFLSSNMNAIERICVPPAKYCSLLFWLAFSELLLHEDVVMLLISSLSFQLEGLHNISRAYGCWFCLLLFFFKKIHNLYFWIIVLLTFRADFFFVTLISLITPCRSLVACRSLLRTQSSPILEVPHVFFASLIILISGSLMIAMRYEIMIIWDKFLLCCMTFLDLIMVFLHQV